MLVECSLIVRMIVAPPATCTNDQSTIRGFAPVTRPAPAGPPVTTQFNEYNAVRTAQATDNSLQLIDSGQ